MSMNHDINRTETPAFDRKDSENVKVAAGTTILGTSRVQMILTIDHIVGKYLSLFSEARFAANLRRVGFSEEGIRNAVAQYREDVATEAEQQQYAERYREDLLELPRFQQLSRYLSLFDSLERAIPLMDSTAEEPADVFWRVFLENWPVCDGLWTIRREILSTLRRRVKKLSPIELMNEDDRRFYASLPDRVTVFRGCGSRRVRSLPWTTDRDIAEYFAGGGRFRSLPKPVIACAEIKKAHVFFVSAAREESEVILDFERVERLRLEPLR